MEREELRSGTASKTLGSKTVGAAVVLLVLVGLLLRLTGIGFLLPHRTPPDSWVFTKQVEELRNGFTSTDGKRDVRFYPLVIPHLLLLGYSPGDPDVEPRTLEEHLDRAARPPRRMRIVLAILSLLVVPATWLLARKFLEPGWALAAAAFMAASCLHICFAQQERPHAAASGLILLAVVAALDLRRRPVARSFVFAGLSMGLAVGSLQHGISVLLPFAAAVALAGDAQPGVSSRRRLLGTVIALAITAVFVVLCYPSLFRAGVSRESTGHPVPGAALNFYGHRLMLEAFHGRGFGIVLWTFWNFEPLIAILAILGAGFLLRRLFLRGTRIEGGRKRDLAVVAAHAIPYFAALAAYDETQQRFCLPLLPYAAILAAYSLREVTRGLSARLRTPLARLASVAGVVILGLGSQAALAGKLVWTRAAPDTLTQAATWIRENLHPGEDRILLGLGADLPVLQTSHALEVNRRLSSVLPCPWWFSYQTALAPSQRDVEGYDLEMMPLRDPAQRAALQRDPAEWLRSLHARYAVVEKHADWGYQELRILARALGELGKLVQRFDPDPPGSVYPVALEYQDDSRYRFHWLWRMLRARCTGPVIEIYKLDE